MNSITEHQISKWLWRVIAVVLSASPPAAILWARDSIAQHLQGVAPVQIVQAGAVLLAIMLFLVAYIVLQHPFLKWDEPTGTWVSRRTAIRYCGTCRAKKIIVPLKNEVTGWRCVACNTFRTDPERKPKAPAEEPPYTGPNSWMAR